MPTILCYGDSNTWGAVPGKDRRFAASERWPGRLRGLLPADFEVIEEGQPGRTTVHDDPVEGEKNGLRYLRPCLESHLPDLVVLLLGTNDLKHRLGLSAFDVAEGVGRLGNEILTFQSWVKPISPKLLLIAPPPIREVGYFADMFRDGELKSAEFGQRFKAKAAELNCGFFDAASVIHSCPKEGIHWRAEQHKLFASALVSPIKAIIESAN
ncbi:MULTISPECIES: SGNH/GDSL hydrolase family protein [Corallincola]|uniref:G-D-S-L family lipolytic protein n=2 Tax=Corallincola TaxID=1775176 RepID=A0A368NEZ2_9GAMM|nr:MULTISPECIES: SGNH/GDSL hydrolase family protein [Corallincola]RCU49217.1 G-D-S-L family lipolytic protein [Corallincola holothuriorum]TAA47483.1 G-D-S-L family lipolytic protein [Corallincola spongiicola]